MKIQSAPLYCDMNPKILLQKFSKLEFKSRSSDILLQSYFPTLRPTNPFNFNIGSLQLIILNNQILGLAEVVAKASFNISRLHDTISYMESNMSAKEKLKELKITYPMLEDSTVFDFITLRWHENFREIMNNRVREAATKK